MTAKFSDAVAAWEARGKYMTIGDDRIFVIDVPPAEAITGDSVFIVHGFPTCTFDWRGVVDALAAGRRVVAFDQLGYGLSDKPDAPYSLFAQADLAEEVVKRHGLESVALVTHDMGDSVGGELLARSLEGTLGFEVSRRVVSNGSIYLDEAGLTDGQKLLRAMPDAKLPTEMGADPTGFFTTMRDIAGDTKPTDEELEAQWELLCNKDGQLLMARTVKYLNERAEHEGRWTGAIETHPAPLTIVWADKDPVAVWLMAEKLKEARPDANLIRLAGVGHYPMVEAPGPFADGVLGGI